MRSSRPGRAHPRACGENHAQLMLLISDHGSSPRVRGKPHGRPSGPPRRGLIPARAGKTMFALVSAAKSTAHPRACGENQPEDGAEITLGGSSPRVRGKLEGPRRRGAETGLIPARAGKTPARPRRSRPSRAHPRACGENENSCASTHWASGSSPRVRGKLGPRCGSRRRPRLIPARAGKTSSSPPAQSGTWAHPRACGENGLGELLERAADGSSPRVRGKPRRSCCSMDNGGLIPARAGKTCSTRRRRRRRRAHPRACGENT